eukprot:sb/3479255/
MDVCDIELPLPKLGEKRDMPGLWRPEDPEETISTQSDRFGPSRIAIPCRTFETLSDCATLYLRNRVRPSTHNLTCQHPCRRLHHPISISSSTNI